MYKKFKQLLDKSGKTTYQVSKETGISQTAFSNWKAGRCNPNIKNISIISGYFDVPIEYFLEVTEDEKEKHGNN